MPLTKEEKLPQKYLIADENDKLQEKIFELERKKEVLISDFKSLTKSIKSLEKEKAEKSWQITCLNIITFGIFKYHRNKKNNKKIRKMQMKLKKLRKKIIENNKIKESLENQTLIAKVTTELIKTLKNLLSNSKEQIINVRTEINQEVSQKLDAILEQQKFKTIADTNLSSSLTPDSSGYNSEDEQQLPNAKLRLQNSKDSGFDDILKYAPAVTSKKLNYDDDDGIEVIPEPEENDEDDGIEVILEPEENDEDDGIEVILEPEENDEDDGIEVILEPEEDNISEQKSIWLLERQGSEDSGFDDELEQSVFDQKSVNSYDLVGFSNLVNNFHQKNEI